MHDALTGLANRKRLVERDRRRCWADRDGRAIARALLDLDRFKEINDTLGHHTGDLLLQQVAAPAAPTPCAAATPSPGSAATSSRVLLADVGATRRRGRRVAERIRDALREPFELDGHRRSRSSASIGIALLPDARRRRRDAAPARRRRDVRGQASTAPASQSTTRERRPHSPPTGSR